MHVPDLFEGFPVVECVDSVMMLMIIMLMMMRKFDEISTDENTDSSGDDSYDDYK